MAKEIERKFLVHPRKWSDLGPGLEIRQGYLSASKQSSVRVRTYGDKAFVAIKGSTKDITRDEYEYEIPLNDANEMLAAPPKFASRKGPTSWPASSATLGSSG